MRPKCDELPGLGPPNCRKITINTTVPMTHTAPPAMRTKKSGRRNSGSIEARH
jgi:hypothetical protein